MRTIKPTGQRRIVSLDEAMRRVERYEKPEVVEQTEMPEEGVIRYKNLMIEQRCTEQEYSFGNSLTRLKKAGFERHLTPKEYFELIFDHLEGKLSGEIDVLAEDLLFSPGEWMHFAWMRKEGDFPYVLYCYTDPKPGITIMSADQYLELYPKYSFKLHHSLGESFHDFFDKLKIKPSQKWPEQLKTMNPTISFPFADSFDDSSYASAIIHSCKDEHVKIFSAEKAYSRGVREIK